MAMTTADIGYGIEKVGQYTMYTGVFGMFVMAVVGTISADLVFLWALKEKAKNKQPVNFLYTMYLWHCFSGTNQDPFVLLLISPITTLLAIALSFALDVSFVGLYLAGGWTVAVGLVIAGYALSKLGEWLSDDKPIPEQTREFGLFNSSSYLVPSAPIETDGFIYNQNGLPIATSTPCQYPQNPFITSF